MVDNNPQVQVYSTLTQSIKTVPQNIADGNPDLFQPIADQPVALIGPDGNKYSIPALSAGSALSNGYSFDGSILDQTTAENNQKARVLDYASKERNVLARKFINVVAGGVPENIEDAIYNKTDEQKAGEQIALTKAEQEHPYLSAAATILGIGGNLAAGIVSGGASLASSAGEGITSFLAGESPGLLRSAASTVAGQALEGGIWSAPTAISQAIAGDKVGAAETIGSGLAIGGILGGATRAIGAGWQHFTGIGATDRAALIARGLVDDSGNISTDAINSLTTDIKNADAGLNTPNLTPELNSKVANLVDQYGIKDINQSSLRGVKQDILSDIADQKPAIDKAIGSQTIDSLKPTNIAQDLSKEIFDSRPGLGLPVDGKLSPENYQNFLKGEPSRNLLNEITGKISKLGTDPIGLSDMQDAIKSIGKSVAKVDDPLAKSVGRQALDILNTRLETATAEALGKAKLTPEFATYFSKLDNLQTINSLLGHGGEAFTNLAKQSSSGLGTQIASRLGGNVARRAVGWGIRGLATGAGFATAGPIGGAAGYALGTVAGGLARRAIKTAISNRTVDYALASQTLGISAKLLDKIANNTEAEQFLGAALTKAANDGIISKLASVSGTITGKVAQTVSASDYNPIKMALGSNANGLSKDQQLNKVVSLIQQAKANDDHAQNQAAAIGAVFHHDDELQSLIANQHAKTLDYLAQSVPPKGQPGPFGAPAQQPTKQQVKDFTDKLEIAQNPWAVLDHAKAGNLSAAHVDAFNNLYPNLKQQLVQRIGVMAYDPKTPPISNGVKQELSKLTGVNLTNQNNINYQAAYQTAPPAPPGAGTGKHRGGGSTRPKFDKLPSLSTSTQKLNYK